MENIDNYKCVESKSGTSLTLEVQRLIEKGWQPLGGMQINPVLGNISQTMVKYKRYTHQDTGPG